jgi:LysR family transcriptional regulator, glycine cleavage system transcriptional activator
MARRLPPLNALVVFEAAARHLSFTRASEELHVTQAAVSHQIKSLEDHLGIVLFHRLGRGQGLVLTEAGLEYLPAITSALEAIRVSTDLARREKPKRILNIATLDSIGSRWLLPRLSHFIREHPAVDVRITAAAPEEHALQHAVAEIELRYGSGEWPDLDAVRFMSESIFPVCSPKLLHGQHPLRQPGDLRHHTLLHDVMNTEWRDWLIAAGATDVDPERGPGFNHSHLVIQAAEMGEGVALGRGALVLDALESGTLVRPFALTLPAPFTYYVVTAPRAAKNAVVAAFCDWVILEGAASQTQLDHILSATLTDRVFDEAMDQSASRSD